MFLDPIWVYSEFLNSHIYPKKQVSQISLNYILLFFSIKWNMGYLLISPFFR